MRLKFFGQRNSDDSQMQPRTGLDFRTKSEKTNNRKNWLRQLPLIATACLTGGAACALFCSFFSLGWTQTGILSGNLSQGLLSVYNSIADQLGKSDYIIIRKFAGGVASDGSSLNQGLFLTMIAFLLSVLAYLILRSGCRWLLLLFAAPPLMLMLFTSLAPGVGVSLVFAFALVVCFAMMQMGEQLSWWIAALPLLVLLVMLTAASGFTDDSQLKMPPLQKRTSQSIQQLVHHRYGSNPLESGNLMKLDGKSLTNERGNSQNVLKQLQGKTRDDTKTALEVTMDTPASCWLRGFIGEAYEDNRWKQLDNAVCYEQRENQFWLNRQGFDGLSQMSAAAVLGGDEEKPVDMRVQVKNADKSLIYVPYEITGTAESIPSGTENYAGSYLKTNRFWGSRKYSYLTRVGLTDRWTDWVGRLYSAKESDALRTYFVSESHQNVWNYEKYTQIPEKLQESLQEAVGDPGDLTRDHADYKEAITAVRGYLDKNCIYTENFSPPENGEDPVKAFLSSGKGSDAQFASAATMLLRWYGIPARYVEGYLITPADAAAAKIGQTMKIGYSHAHAWTELYIDGFGWVPLEVTAEWKKIMPEADLEKGLQAISYEGKPNEQWTVPKEETETEKTDSGLLRILKITGIILLCLFLLWLLLYVLRKLRRIWLRRKAFADPDPRKGVCAMFGYMLDEGIPLTEKADMLGLRAAYSEFEIQESERTAMRQELKWGINEKKKLDKTSRSSLSDRIADSLDRLRRRK